MCGKHNRDYRRLSLEDHVLLMAGYSAKNENERKKNDEHTSLLNQKVDYTTGSPEMHASFIIQDRLKHYLNDHIKSDGYVSFHNAVYDSCNFTGGAPGTHRNWITAWCAPNGLYKITPQDGGKVIIYREPNVNIQIGPNGHKKHGLKDTVPVATAEVVK